MKNNSMFLKIIGSVIALCMLAGIGIGVYLLAFNEEPEKNPVPITSQVHFIDSDEKFNLTRTSSISPTNISYSLSAVNEGSYLYANIWAVLPESCYRYNEIYISFTAEDINQIVFQINNILYKVNNIKKGDNSISFKVNDWGKIPKLLVYPDTYGSNLQGNINENKKMSITEIGFYEPKEV